MTIVDKVIRLLQANASMNLKEIYDSLPEHTQASIRGNINRYLQKSENPEFQRVDKGVYSILEIITVENISETEKSVNYIASYYTGDKEISFIHKSFITSDPDVKTGIYQRMDEFNSFEEMENHLSSLKGILIKDNAVDVLKRLKTESFHCIITDVPYPTIKGGTGGANAPSGMLSKNDGKIFAHNNLQFADYMSELYRVLKEDSHAYFFINFLNLQRLMEEVQKVGFKIHNLLVWEKNNATPNRYYMKNCEYVLFCRKGKAKTITDAGCKTVHQFDNIIGKKIHETEKPIDLLRMYIKNSTKPGDMILDPFAGSGSTLMAALLEDRKCTTIEIDETYIPKIKDRVRHYLTKNYDIRENIA